MKTLKDFYEEKKKQALPSIKHILTKPKHDSQETLNKYINQNYRIRKLKEAEYFREEWTEPEIIEIKSQA